LLEGPERRSVVSGMPDPVPKPVTYDYEFYENTFYNDPSWNLVTERPLLPFSVGDYINNEISQHFFIDKSKDEMLQITGIWHILSDVLPEKTHHRLAICLKRVPTPEIFR
jgi:hypothetical protein